MPGTITFRPIEANLTHNTDILTNMNPYCTFIVGNERINGEVCKNGGKHPQWNDVVSIPYNNEPKIMVEVMDKSTFTRDGHIGSFTIDVSKLQSQSQSSKWYPLLYKDEPAGEILVEANIKGGANIKGEAKIKGEAFITEPTMLKKKEIIASQKPIVEEGVKTFIEQRQHVEPHTFTKEVDVVETRPVEKTIEVTEARKVLKDVQYTEAVPVKKTIETIEPRVIKKQVEVMEPKLVTKTIQVVENVPVKKEVEVIESVPVKKEVETFEPKTFTKQVEVTEQVPVTKTVTVTEPVHLKKAVEFVEPIITTETITKEIRPEVIVNEETTTSVGPATYTGEFKELGQKISQITLTKKEKARYLAMSEKERLALSAEERLKWHEARRLYGDKAYMKSTLEQGLVKDAEKNIPKNF